MKRRPIALPVVVVSTLTATVVVGQSEEGSAPRPGELVTERGPVMDQFHVGYLMGFNITARLKNIGSGSAGNYPASVTGLTYQDGYVGRDISGNKGHLSWYWGYAKNEQIVGDNLLLSYSGSGAAFENIKDNPQHGLEVGYSWRYGGGDGGSGGCEGGLG